MQKTKQNLHGRQSSTICALSLLRATNNPVCFLEHVNIVIEYAVRDQPSDLFAFLSFHWCIGYRWFVGMFSGQMTWHLEYSDTAEIAWRYMAFCSLFFYIDCN